MQTKCIEFFRLRVCEFAQNTQSLGQCPIEERGYVKVYRLRQSLLSTYVLSSVALTNKNEHRRFSSR